MKLCSVEGCGVKHHAKGLCVKHYHQSPDVKAYMKAYRQRPDVKAYMKAYQQRPEVKAYRKAYYQRPDVKAYRKAYQQRPEARAYQKAYRQRPEMKAYLKAYRQSPEVKSRRDFLKKEHEYQRLSCLYRGCNGKIPTLKLRRLEALSDVLGRDLEEWRTPFDKERHAKMLKGDSE